MKRQPFWTKILDLWGGYTMQGKIHILESVELIHLLSLLNGQNTSFFGIISSIDNNNNQEHNQTIFLISG